MVCFCCSDSNEVSNEELSAARRDQRARDSVETQWARTRTHTHTPQTHTNTPALWRRGNYHPPPVTAVHIWPRPRNLSAMCGWSCDVVFEALTDKKQSSRKPRSLGVTLVRTPDLLGCLLFNDKVLNPNVFNFKVGWKQKNCFLSPVPLLNSLLNSQLWFLDFKYSWIATFTNANLTEFNLKFNRTTVASISAKIRMAQMQWEVKKHLGGEEWDRPPVWMASAGFFFSVFTPSLLFIALLNNQFSVCIFFAWV